MQLFGQRRGLAILFAIVIATSSALAEGTRSGTFTVTAYCQQGITKSGVFVRPGVAAADPSYLPIGSVVHVAASAADTGVYTVLDTGAKVLGRHIDLFKPDCWRAKLFGRQLLRVTILRLGWNRFPARAGRERD